MNGELRRRRTVDAAVLRRLIESKKLVADADARAGQFSCDFDLAEPHLYWEVGFTDLYRWHRRP